VKRFDIIELGGAAAVALLCGLVLGRQAPIAEAPQNQHALVLGWDGSAEVGALQAKYGPQRASRNAEEWIIRDFFNDRREGVFLDVGANHFHDESNTYYLETVLGWSGIAVEPQQQFAADYASHRPRTTFVPMFASDSEGTTPFFVPRGNSLVASLSREFTENQGSPGDASNVPTTTLNAVLDAAHVAHVDFLSMDVELAEPKALAGFNIDRFKPDLVCIEAHPEVRQSILAYFQQHGYIVVGKYLRADTLNLYFQPLPETDRPGR
jgi:FkbM family methyltransferase